jgi:hypothetical protein
MSRHPFRAFGASVVCALCLTLPTEAECAPVFTVGVLGGANGTRLAGDTPRRGSFKTGPGYQVGGFAAIAVDAHVVFGVAALYQSASPRVEIKIDDDDSTLKRTQDVEIASVVVPITLQYAFGERRTRVFVGTGVQLGFMQSATLKEDGRPDENLECALESFDFAVLFDVGVASRFRWLDWFVQARTAIGFVDIATGDPLDTGRGATVWKTRSLQLLVGIAYSFGR